MDIEVKKEEPDANTPNSFSPYWNEFFVDGAFISADGSNVRMSFVNRLPHYTISGKQTFSMNRQVDLVMSERSFYDLMTVMEKIKKQIENKDQE
jgi:hypothetical protein